MVEPIQAEGGVRTVPTQCLRGLRELCDERGLLLILDEVQTGVGRTGKLFAHERSGIAPDIMSVAKGIGGGFPLGACLATAEAAQGHDGRHPRHHLRRQPARHGGRQRRARRRPRPGLPPSRRADAIVLKQRLAELKDRHPAVVAEIRGEGLLLGLRTHVPNTDFAAAARAEGLLTVPAGDNVVRLMPPLVIGEEEVREAFRPPRRGRDGPGRGDAGDGPAGSGRVNGARHFLDLSAFSGAELRDILKASADLKSRRRKGEPPRERPLAGKQLAMVFDKPSTRTRVSFDVAMRELGGETIMLTGKEMQLGRGETIADTARVLSRYVDAVMIRILDHGMMLELAEHATVPVINGLTKLTHPCQVMADVLTFEEHRGPIGGRKSPGRGTRTTCSPPGSTPPRASISGLPSRRLPSSIPGPISWPGRRPKGLASSSPATHMKPWTAPTRWSRTAGSPWATRTRAAVTTCSNPIR